MCLWRLYYLHLAQLFLYTTVIINSVRYLDDGEKARHNKRRKESERQFEFALHQVPFI